MTDFVIVTDDGPVRTVRMNRPDKKNALTLAMYDAMAAAIENAPKIPALRCLLIAGTPTAFCAGNDIGDFLKMATGEGALGAPILRFLNALARCELPQGGMVKNANELRPSVCSLTHVPGQPKKSWMVYKVLVYARRYGR